MKKTFFSICLLILAVMCVNAQPVSMEAAKQKAVLFMQQNKMPFSQTMQRVARHGMGEQAAPYYIFNAAEQRGFVIVSGDERTDEILGYCLEGSYDEEKIPEVMRAWLEDYEQQITLLQQGKADGTPARLPSHPAIAKLITTAWDQGDASEEGEAYNMLCPTKDGVHCYTGCVATAMAQVMRYNEWPQSFSEEIPAYESERVGKVSKLSKVRFDWKNMLNRYDEGQSDVSCKAVATLMRYCGQSVEMDYGTTASSAYTNDVANGLRTYFGYDVNTRFERRADYTTEAWDDLIYDELRRKRPVVYNGSNPGGGHAFVCDGYDGNGFYHINWGWGGYCNGYYKLSILNPNGGGTGSSTSNGGYSMTQGAVVGIQKPTGDKEEYRTLSVEKMWNENHILYIQFGNRSGLDGTFEYGFAYSLANDDSGSFDVANLSNFFERFAARTVNIDLDNWELDDGVYNFYPFSRVENMGWYHVVGDFSLFFEVTISKGAVKKIVYHPSGDLHIKSTVCKGNCVVGIPQEVVFAVVNEAEEYNGDFYLFASQTNEKGKAVDQVTVAFESGVREEASLYFTPNAPGKWNLWLDIDEEGSNNLKPITVDIKAAPKSKSNLKVVSSSIVATTDPVLKVKIRNDNSEGYYRTIYAYLFEDPKRYNITYDRSDYLNLAPKATTDLEFQFECLEWGKEYYIGLKNYVDHQNSTTEWLGNTVTFVVNQKNDPTPVEMVKVDVPSQPADVYSLSGVLVRKGATSLQGLPKGVYVVNGRKQVVR